MRRKAIAAGCLTAAFFLSLLAGCGADPNVRQETTAPEDYDVELENTADEAVNPYGFHAYASGKTDPVTVGGVEISPNACALRSFELGYMIGESFGSVKELSLDAAVQYGMTHLFYENFYKIDNRSVAFRNVFPEKVEKELTRQFGKTDYDLTKSVFYNPSTKKLEMWIPEYGRDLYYNVDAADVSGKELTVVTTFYNEQEKSTLFGKATITVEAEDGGYVIRSVASELRE